MYLTLQGLVRDCQSKLLKTRPHSPDKADNLLRGCCFFPPWMWTQICSLKHVYVSWCVTALTSSTTDCTINRAKAQISAHTISISVVTVHTQLTAEQKLVMFIRHLSLRCFCLVFLRDASQNKACSQTFNLLFNGVWTIALWNFLKGGLQGEERREKIRRYKN